jgi:hypothetical protein
MEGEGGAHGWPYGDVGWSLVCCFSPACDCDCWAVFFFVGCNCWFLSMLLGVRDASEPQVEGACQ